MSTLVISVGDVGNEGTGGTDRRISRVVRERGVVR